MQYFKKITIPINPLVDTFDLLSQTTIHERISFKNVNPELISFFKSKNIEIKAVECFYRTPNSRRGIHTDASGGDYVKFNWIYGGKNSILRWFKVNPGIHKEPILTHISTPYTLYEPNEVTQTEVTTTNPGTYIIQVGVPHQAINFNEHRHCLSLVPYINDEKIPMHVALELFKEFWC